MLLNDVDDSRAPQLFFGYNGVATIVKTQERAQESVNERRNKQLFISIGKEDEYRCANAETQCYSEGAIKRLEAVKRTRALVADKPPAKRKSKIMNVTEWKSLLDSREITQYFLQL